MADQVQLLIDAVEGGVCKNLDELCREVLDIELETLTKVETDEIDENLFTCERCSWTMPRDEESQYTDGLCAECYDDENPEDREDE